jgi:hypothetical protein
MAKYMFMPCDDSDQEPVSIAEEYQGYNQLIKLTSEGSPAWVMMPDRV